MNKKYIFLSILLSFSINGVDTIIKKKNIELQITKGKESSLFQAVENNDIEKVTKLMKQEINPNITNEDGQTPLHIACRENKNLEIAKTLIEHGANINAKDNNGHTPLAEAVIDYESKLSNDARIQELVKYLLSKGADINSIDKSEHDILSKAIFLHNGSEDLIKILIDNGIDLTRPFKFHDGTLMTPLMLAIGSGYSESMIRYLMDHGANDYGFKIPSQEAADFLYKITGNYLLLPMIDSVKILIEEMGINPNTITSEGKTALDGALKSRNFFADTQTEDMSSEYRKNAKDTELDREKIIEYLKEIGAKKSNKLLNKDNSANN